MYRVYRNRLGITQNVLVNPFQFTPKSVTVLSFSDTTAVPNENTILIYNYAKFETAAVEFFEANGFTKFEPSNLRKPIYAKENVYGIPGLSIQIINTVAAIVMDLEYPNIPEEIRTNWYSGSQAIYDKYQHWIKHNQEDERYAKLLELLPEILECSDTTKTRELTNRINELNNSVQRMRDQISEYETRLEEQKALLLAETIRTENNTEFYAALAKTISGMRAISNIEKESSNRILFDVDTPLKYLDKQAYDTLINASRGNALKNAKENVRRVLKDVLDKKVQIMMHERVRLSVTDGTLQTIGTVAIDGLANPHHKYYNCWGDYATPIRRAASEGDLETELALIVTAVSGINLYDVPVLEKFIHELECYSELNILRTKDKRRISINKYCEELEEQEAENEAM